MKSPVWLRRLALPIAMLGVAHIMVVWPVWKANFGTLPLKPALAALFLLLATGLWIVASGFVLGFLAEADKIGEDWAAPFARGVTNFLLVGGFLACALMWTTPFAWALGILSLLARFCARKPPALIPRDEAAKEEAKKG